jgi:serralysin
MAGPQEIPLTSTDIDALLTGYRWDTNDLTFSFPDSRWWYVLDAVLNELDPLDVVEAFVDWLDDPVGGFIDALGTAVLGDFDAGVIAVIALNGFEEFNAAQEATARFGMNSAAALTNLTFSKTILEIDVDIFPPGFNVTFGDLRFAESDSISSTSPAFGVPPIQRFETLLGRSFLGDMWFKGDGTFDTPEVGNYAFTTIMHELGHALGLKHAHEVGLLGSGGILNDILTDIEGPILRDELNSLEFTIMTYRSALKTAANPNIPDSLIAETWGYAQSFMMLDIAALQYMYGADFSTNADNTTYMWDPNDGTMSINGVRQRTPGASAPQTDIDAGLTNRVFLTIWDGFGNDTYDMSNYGGGVNIDLRPGRWSITNTAQLADLDGNRGNAGRSIGLAQGNVYNALQYDNDDPRSLIENAIGGGGDDTIGGNDIANLLRGGGGNDSITGLLGADTIEGGIGNDTIDGGADDDSLTGGDGDDSITGGDGADTIDAGAGNDTVLAGAGIDTVHGGDGNDSIDGGSEDDVLHGDAGNDTIVGGDGNDSILAGAGNDSVQGGNGVDTVFGGDGDDTINGGDADDVLAGELGNDSIDGAGGNDSITGADGSDTLVGGVGLDTLDGGAGSDSLDGGDDADLLNAGDGNDTVFGGGGNDTVTAGDGDDSVFGGAGFDSIDAGSGNDTVFGGGDADTILGGAGLDVVSGGDGADFIDGGSDADNLAGDDGDDTILGALGADTIAVVRAPTASTPVPMTIQCQAAMAMTPSSAATETTPSSATRATTWSTPATVPTQSGVAAAMTTCSAKMALTACSATRATIRSRAAAVRIRSMAVMESIWRPIRMQRVRSSSTSRTRRRRRATRRATS